MLYLSLNFQVRNQLRFSAFRSFSCILSLSKAKDEFRRNLLIEAS